MTNTQVVLTVVVNADPNTEPFDLAKQVEQRLTGIAEEVHPAPTSFVKDDPTNDELDYTLLWGGPLWVRVGDVALQISPWREGAKVTATPHGNEMETIASTYFPPGWEANMSVYASHPSAYPADVRDAARYAAAARPELAAAAERDATVSFLRRQGDLMSLENPNAAAVLRALALCIEHGDHRR